MIPKLWLAKIVQSSLRNQKNDFLFTAWLNSEHVSSVIDNKVLEWSVVGPDFILVECQIWMIIITFLSCSDPTTNIGWKYSLHNHRVIKSYIIWNLFLNIRKKSFSTFILHNIQYDSHRKTTLLSDLIRHEKTLVINQSHIKYGSLCFYATLCILIFLLFQNRIIISLLQQLMMQQMEKVHILIKLCAIQKQAVS